MKKIVVGFLLLFLLCPFHIRAVSIQSSSISGVEKVTIGEEFSLTFNIYFLGLQKDMTDTFGIVAVAFELGFDDSVFTVKGVSVNDWITTVEKEDGSYYVESAIKEGNSPNKCIDGLLHCSNYSVTITFAVNDTDKTSSTIQMGDIVVGLLNVDYVEELSDDTILLEGVSDQSKNITIEKKNETPQINESKPVPEPSKVETPQKSNNNYLKNLKIDNHTIHFLKTQNEYRFTVAKDENQLAIYAETEDEKAIYQVIGADNLKENNYQVRIEVTAENGEKNTYQLNINVREDSGVIYERPEEKKSTKFVWKNSYIVIGIILLGLIITIVTIVKIKDRKIDKKLDQF